MFNCPNIINPELPFQEDLCNKCLCNDRILIGKDYYSICNLLRILEIHIVQKHQKKIEKYCIDPTLEG